MPSETDALDIRAALERQAMAEDAEQKEAARRLPSEGPGSDFLMGAGSYILNRTPGIAPHMQGGPLPPDNLASTLGGMAPSTGLSMFVPGSGVAGVLAQGGLSAGLEYLRPDSTNASIMKEGAFGAAATGAFDIAGRTLGGMGARIRAKMAQGADEIVRTTSQRLSTLA